MSGQRGLNRGGFGATIVLLLLCCCGGGLLSLGDDDDASAEPYRPRVASTASATPATPASATTPATSDPGTTPPASESATSPAPSRSTKPQERGTPRPTADTGRAACIKRSKRSAAAVHFDEDHSDICAYLPDYDFGVSARTYSRCVQRSRKYHVKSYTYEYTCRYDPTYRWSETDDPDYTYEHEPEVPAYDPGHSYTPSVPTDVPDLGDGMRPGCTWVNSYYRKDGTYVRGHYRC